MVRARAKRLLARVRHEILTSITEDSSRQAVAGSFAIGAFITILPTLGLGLIVFLILDYLFEWINRVALFSNAIIFNPVVKWGIYVASMITGFVLLGPVEGASLTSIPTMEDGTELLVRMFVGNVVIAVVGAVTAYVVVDRLLAAYQSHQFPVVEETVDEFVHEAAERDPELRIDD